MKIKALRLIGGSPIHPTASRDEALGNIRALDVDASALQSGELRAEPQFVGVCGSDVSASLGKPNFDWVERPRTIGHECCARITELGPEVAEFAVGDLICVVPMLGCGQPTCRGCGRGRPNYCREKTIFGFHRDGAFAEQMTVEAARCLPVRAGLTPQQAAVIEPLSVVAQGIHRKCAIQPGMDVIVSGCGIIGMMAAELARAAGARVAVTGLETDREIRLRLAASQGFTTIVVSEDQPLHQQLAAGIDDTAGHRFGDPHEHGSVDVLIECSGAPPALATAGLSVQLEGHVLAIATYPREVAFAATPFVRSGQTLAGVMGSNREDFQTAQKLLAENVFPVDAYVQEYAFRDASDAFFDSIKATTTKAIVAVSS